MPKKCGSINSNWVRPTHLEKLDSEAGTEEIYIHIDTTFIKLGTVSFYCQETCEGLIKCFPRNEYTTGLFNYIPEGWMFPKGHRMKRSS